MCSIGGSRTAATSKEELFAIIVNGWKPLTIITKNFILDVAVVLDTPLQWYIYFSFNSDSNLSHGTIFGGTNNFSSITLFKKALYERRMSVLKKFLHHKISSDKSSLRCYVFSMPDSECYSDNQFDL